MTAPQVVALVRAHFGLRLRHRRESWGYWPDQGPVLWRYCIHRSHRVGLPCWRFMIYDAQCAQHNGSCYSGCENPDRTETSEARSDRSD